MKVRERHYPQGVLERVQELDLSMLRAFDALCRAEGLTYFVDGGTCLGAIRHGGFIPWDDDVDVAMPIDDYRTFLRIAPDLLPQGMSLATPENTPNYAYLWAKIYLDGTRFQDEATLEAGLAQCVFIDVFPYIPLGSSLKRATRTLAKVERWQKISYLRHMSHTNIPANASHRVLKAAACVLAHAVISRTVGDTRIRRTFEGSFPRGATGEIWGNPTATRPFPYAHDVLFDPCELDFCGLRVFAPHDPDAYLTQLYGDYMTLPAPEKRHVHTPVILDFGDGTNAMDQE